MTRIFSLILFVILLITHSTLRADLLDASINYTNGEYDKAYKEFHQLALLGNSDAMFNIAVMHLQGRGVAKDLTKAYAWFSVASDFGIADAKSAALQIESQSKNKNSLKSAYKALSSQHNYQDYLDTLAPNFNERYIPNTQPKKTFNVDPVYPEHAVERGIEGWVWLEYDIDNIGAVRNIEIIDSYPEKTFDNALTQAVKRWRFEKSSLLPIKRRSLLYHFTTFKGKRYQQGFAKQQRAYHKHIAEIIEQAENGNALWQYRIGHWLSTNKNNASKLLKYHWPAQSDAEMLMLLSAKNGFPFAQYRIANQLLLGDKTQQDRKKGLNWLLMSAQNGFVHAQYRLGIELLVKQSVQYDIAKAKLWLQQASEQGHLLANLALAQIFMDEKNSQLAQNHITKVLEGDSRNADAMYLKSLMYLENEELDVAKKWLRKAINEGKSQNIDISSYQGLLNQLN
ncbi:TonB family protein [Pseudoalteromonas sp. SSM20]|uniref:TonB family protein n=1 Tax=Pseudoalteromonas sp. SSM20 TaxID=3139394 RepID=UPI003BA8F74F